LAQSKSLTKINLESNNFYLLSQEEVLPLAEGIFKNIFLKSLYLSGNSLVDIQISVDVLNSIMNNTSLQEVDLSRNYLLLSKDALRSLSRGLSKNTTITSLNLSNNLEGLSYSFTNKIISIIPNELSSLAKSISKNNSLKSLDFSYNKLVNIRSNIGFLRFIAKSNSLAYINLENTNLSVINEGIVSFSKGIEKSSNLSILNLRDNNLSDENLIILTNSINKNKTLTKIDFSTNNLSHDTYSLITFLEILSKNTTLTSVSLEQNFLRENSWTKALAQFIAKTLTISELNLASNKLFSNNQTLLELGKGISLNKSLKTLNLSYNYLSKNAHRDREGIISFVNSIQKHDTITNIVLRGNYFGSDLTHEIKNILKDKANFEI
jgi:Ran GTPase-activating protein (RanGAP) involved in mRNA processing and transport